MSSIVRRLSQVLFVVVVSAWPVRADDLDSCKRISFAPLDIDIPACTRLINEGRLTDDQMVAALLVRARAYETARTYRSGHNVEPEKLMAMALADLDRAIGLIRKGGSHSPSQLNAALNERASVLYQLGRSEQAAQDLSEVLRSRSGEVISILHTRALAMQSLQRYDEAIADMNALVRIARDTSNYHNFIYTRGGIYALAGNRDAAIADFRTVLKLDPAHIGAAQALKKLGVTP